MTSGSLEGGLVKSPGETFKKPAKISVFLERTVSEEPRGNPKDPFKHMFLKQGFILRKNPL